MQMKAIPAGYHTLSPYLIVREAEELVEFVKQAFGAEERYRGTGSAGGLHAELIVGDSLLMIGGGPNVDEPLQAALHLYVEDVDTVYQRALQAGASSLGEPEDKPYGDRIAGVRDQSGNTWYLATRIADLSL